MRELEELLPVLTPPRGGLARLQRHVALQGRQRRSPQHGRWAWLAAACVVLVIAAFTAAPWFAERRQAQAMTRALRESMAASADLAAIRVKGGAAIALPSGQANVRLFLVQTAVAGRDAQPR